MTLQAGVQFEEYFRCYVVEPAACPHHALRSGRGRIICATCQGIPPASPELNQRMVNDALTLCRALRLRPHNTRVEFASRKRESLTPSIS